jgi:hypothetical protein
VPAKLDADHARTEGLVDEATGLYNVRGLTRRAQELASFATGTMRRWRVCCSPPTTAGTHRTRRATAPPAR